MAKRITYRQLAARLKELGYADRQITVQGKGLWLFEHPGNKTATIFLPPMPLDQPVETMHLTGVRATLRVHGILEESPDSFLLKAATDTEANGTPSQRS